MAALDELRNTWADLRDALRDARKAIEEAHEDDASWLWKPEDYLYSAFPQELGAARPEAPEGSGGLLVVVVGSSLHPLLLTVALHRPERVLLVASDTGAGTGWAAKLQRLLAHDEFARVAGFRPRVHQVAVEPDDALAALPPLVAAIREARRGDERVVVDITGGRKPMVAAAFLAAIELDLETSYVAAEFDPEVPWVKPGTMRLREFVDPGAALALRRRREVRRAVEDRRFDDAEKLLDEMLEELQSAPEEYQAYAGIAEVQDTRKLVAALAAWSHARYAKAMEGLGEEAPESVKALGARWEELRRGGPRSLARNLLDAPELHARYLLDALRWLRRQDGFPARDRFLRAFALGDFAIEGVFRAWLLAGEVAVEAKWADGRSAEGRPANCATDSRRRNMVSAVISGLGGRNVADLVSGLAGSATGYPTSRLFETRFFGDEHKNSRAPEMNAVVLREDPPLASAAPWSGGHDHRALRNACAHDLAVVSEQDVDAIVEALGSLVPEAIAVIAPNLAGTPADEPADERRLFERLGARLR